MKRAILSLPVLFALLTIPPLSPAEERPDHFKGLPAETLEEAVGNFSEYNGRLEEILSSEELSAADLSAIHELTYTLENALGKINEELTALADVLEEVHLASEHNGYDDVRRHGRQYLDISRRIIE